MINQARLVITTTADKCRNGPVIYKKIQTLHAMQFKLFMHKQVSIAFGAVLPLKRYAVASSRDYRHC